MMAERLCNKQPYQIRYRLLKDEGFISKYDLKPAVGITIAGKIHLNQHVLIRAIKHLFEKKEVTHILDIEGNKHSLSLGQDHINFESASKEIKTQIDNFYILSPDREERVKKLNEIITVMGPMSPDFSKLIADAEHGELSYEQIDELLHELYTGVAALQDRTRQAFDTQQATFENLVPSDLSYYEYFCGPDPSGADPEEYLGSNLPNYRKELIKRNFVEGLDVCLQGALRDDLMPGAWIKSYSDDEAWNGLQACDPFRDPFALLGALDLALRRQNDERYQSFAEKAVATLVKGEFLRPDGIDVYELLPMVAKLILNRINIIEGGALRPPYWKRMCAWMQSGFLIRQTQRFTLDLEGLRSWVDGNMKQAGIFACVLDLQREPMYRATETTRSSFREEIVGRLRVARDRHKKDGREIPLSDDIDKAVSKLESQSSPISWRLPGPLEGHKSPAEKGIKMPEDGLKDFSEELFKNETERVLSSLTYLSQFWDFGEALLARVRKVVTKTTFDDKFEGFPKILMRIIDAGFIACAHRDVELSRAIGEKIIATSSWTNSEYNVGVIINALLIAGAGFQKKNEWAKWLEEKLAEVAYHLPPGESTTEFLAHLRELKKVLNIKMGIHCRAEAIVSAAI